MRQCVWVITLREFDLEAHGGDRRGLVQLLGVQKFADDLLHVPVLSVHSVVQAAHLRVRDLSAQLRERLADGGMLR